MRSWQYASSGKSPLHIEDCVRNLSLDKTWSQQNIWLRSHKAQSNLGLPIGGPFHVCCKHSVCMIRLSLTVVESFMENLFYWCGGTPNGNNSLIWKPPPRLPVSGLSSFFVYILNHHRTIRDFNTASFMGHLYLKVGKIFRVGASCRGSNPKRDIFHPLAKRTMHWGGYYTEVGIAYNPPTILILPSLVLLSARVSHLLRNQLWPFL